MWKLWGLRRRLEVEYEDVEVKVEVVKVDNEAVEVVEDLELDEEVMGPEKKVV